jgi:flagellar biosynthesis protein FliR
MNLTDFFSQVGAEFGITDVTATILLFALLMSRVLPVIFLSPFLGGESVPPEVKIGTGVTLGIVLFPGLIERVANIPLTPIPFLALMLKELFIGVSISFIVGMIFQAAVVGGTLIDTMAGTNQAQLHVPQVAHQVSLFSTLKLELAVVLFLTLNGHHLVINAFADSLVLIPLDQYPKFSGGMWPFFEGVIRVFAELMRIGLAISAPAFLTAFLTDLAMGMINRVAPQLQVFFIAMQVKPMATVLVMMVAIHVILQRVVGEYGNMFKLIQQALKQLT